MTDLEDSFAKLLGRHPSDKQRQDLYRVRDALELGSNDALWLVLMALQHYEDLYERVPAQIAEAAEETLRGFQKAAETTAHAAAAETKRELIGAVTAAARDVAEHVEAREKLKWLCAALAVCIVGVGGLVTWSTPGEERRGTASATATVMMQPVTKRPQRHGRRHLKGKSRTVSPRRAACAS